MVRHAIETLLLRYARFPELRDAIIDGISSSGHPCLYRIHGTRLTHAMRKLVVLAYEDEANRELHIEVLSTLCRDQPEILTDIEDALLIESVLTGVHTKGRLSIDGVAQSSMVEE